MECFLCGVEGCPECEKEEGMSIKQRMIEKTVYEPQEYIVCDYCGAISETEDYPHGWAKIRIFTNSMASRIDDICSDCLSHLPPKR